VKAILAKCVMVGFVGASASTLWLFLSPSAPAFYLAFPGAAVFLLIAGGHGGTHFENTIGVVLGFLTNVLLYALFFCWLSSWWLPPVQGLNVPISPHGFVPQVLAFAPELTDVVFKHSLTVL
jgi:hypothetical protein